MSDQEDKLRVGDPVRVRNIPGPRMIISGFEPNPKSVALICCKWFDKRSELQTEWFPAKFLVRVAPWIERPGYRAALERVRSTLSPPSDEVDEALISFIDGVLMEHPFDRGAPAPTEQEHADVAD